MLIGTNLLISFSEIIKSKLSAPSVGFPGGFNVLTETDIRNKTVPSSGSAPLWLVNTHISPTVMTLPFIGVEIVDGTNTPIEMGSVNGKMWEGLIHIYAKSRAQRTDIASFLASPRTMTSFPVNDYTSGSPVLIENAEIDITKTKQYVLGTVEDDFEGTWRNREVVSISMFTMSN